MEKVLKIEEINSMIIEVRGQSVLIDSDVAKIYGVETKIINQAVKNNLEKFPHDYLFELNSEEKNELVKNFDQFNKLKHSYVNIKAFTEKGLYMLATILKSKKAVNATFAIIETFAKIKNLQKNINELYLIQDKSKQQQIVEKSSNIFLDLFDNDLDVNDSETSFEINLAVLKFKHNIKKKK